MRRVNYIKGKNNNPSENSQPRKHNEVGFKKSNNIWQVLRMLPILIMKLYISVRFQNVKDIKIESLLGHKKVGIHKGNICTKTRPGKLKVSHRLRFWPLALVNYTRLHGIRRMSLQLKRSRFPFSQDSVWLLLALLTRWNKVCKTDFLERQQRVNYLSLINGAK